MPSSPPQNATWTLQIQEEYAANTTIQLSPDDPLPSEVAPTTVPGTDGASAAGSGRTGGTVAGIVLGTLAGILTVAGLAVLALCCVRRRRHHRRGWHARARRHRRVRHGSQDPDGMGPASMLSPLSPLSSTARHGSPPAGSVGGDRSMSDRGGGAYFGPVDYGHSARTPPLAPAAAPHHMQFHRPYYAPPPPVVPGPAPLPQTYPGLPIYNSMATMGTLSSQASQASTGVPQQVAAVAASPFTDKAYYGTQRLPTPVELPTAGAVDGLRPPPPVVRAESPTMGMDGRWGKDEETERSM